MTDNELFFCTNCTAVGTLDGELRCGKCHSDSVISTERITSIIQNKKPPTLYEVFVGPFRCTRYAFSKDQAIANAITEGSWHVQFPSDLTGMYTPTANEFLPKQSLEETP